MKKSQPPPQKITLWPDAAGQRRRLERRVVDPLVAGQDGARFHQSQHQRRQRTSERLARRHVSAADVEVGKDAVGTQLRGGARQGLEKVADEQVVGRWYAIGMRCDMAIEHIDVAALQAMPEMIVGAPIAEPELQHGEAENHAERDQQEAAPQQDRRRRNEIKTNASLSRRLEYALLAGRRRRIRVIEIAWHDAHVVLG